MCLNGMNVARLNFSHGSYDEHQNNIDLIKGVREKLEILMWKKYSLKAAKKAFNLSEGDSGVLTGGLMNGSTGNTNIIKVENI